MTEKPDETLHLTTNPDLDPQSHVDGPADEHADTADTGDSEPGPYTGPGEDVAAGADITGEES